MSLVITDSILKERARLFAVLGDITRLNLVTQLVDGKKRSITELSASHNMSRQAVSKHLKLLESAGMVSTIKVGRETLYKLRGDSFVETREMLESIENRWKENLGRLKTLLKS